MRPIITLILLSFLHQISAQVIFIGHFDDLQNGRRGVGRSIKPVPSGYLVFAEQNGTVNVLDQHIFVRLIDLQGQVLQEHEYQPSSPHFFLRFHDPITMLTDGTLAGVIKESNGGPTLFHFNGSGDTIATIPLTTLNELEGQIIDIRTTSTGENDLLLTGTQILSGTYRAFLARITMNGDTIFTTSFGSHDHSYRGEVSHVYLNGHATVGSRSPGPGRNFLIRTDGSGHQLWERTVSVGLENGVALAVTSDDHLITVCTYRPYPTSSEDWPANHYEIMATKWNSAGEIVWQTTHGRGYYRTVADMLLLDDDSFVIGSTINGLGAITKFNSEGDSLWTRPYSLTSNFHWIHDIEKTPDGGFLITGEADRHPQFDDDLLTSQIIWFVVTDSSGCIIPGCDLVGVKEILVHLNDHLKAWPSPASGLLNLQLEIRNATLHGTPYAILQNSQGKTVLKWQLISQDEFLGAQMILPDLASGIYHLHVHDDRQWLAGTKIMVE